MKLRIKSISISALSIVLALFVLVSCQKENSQTGSNDQQEAEASRASSEADGEAEGMFNNLFDDVMGANDDVGIAGTGIYYGRQDTLSPVPRCFTVTIEHPNGTPFPVRIVVNFGTTGCTGPDGHTRRGKVITEYTARLITPGAVAVTVFDGFYVDDIKVEGTHKITNISATNIPRKYKVEVIDGKLTRTNGNYIKWNSTKFITQVDGLITPTPLDDVLKIEGSARGQVLRGNLLVAWESAITEPLIKRYTCRWIVRGRIRTVRLNTNTNSPWVAVLDFGNGNCDNQAVLIINGQTIQITLP